MLIREFFNTEFKEFSSLDNVRSIPSLIDGFKDSQRKAVYAMILHGNSEIKVSQMASQATLKTAYKHGESSMSDTIVNLAQNFTGSNNVNLFEPIGQFGSILSSIAAADRYIYVKPSKHLREYIRVDDDCILEHHYEDGVKIEPKYFLPILPMWIVNGAIGIGTGHSVKILPRNAENVKAVIKAHLQNKNQRETTIDNLLKPSFNGWKGEVIEVEPGKFELHGVIEIENTTTLKVTELPPGYGVDKFKTILADLIDAGKVRDFDNNSTEDGFYFEIKVPREVSRLGIDELKKMFKLITRVTENITLWDTLGVLKQYERVHDALLEFIDFRLSMYEQRRLSHIENLENEIEFLEQKRLFIITWNNIDNPGKKRLDELKLIMEKAGVKPEFHDRLFSMRIASLSLDLIKELEAELKTKESKVQELKKSTSVDLYLADL